jgi:hypothetical protein
MKSHEGDAQKQTKSHKGDTNKRNRAKVTPANRIVRRHQNESCEMDTTCESDNKMPHFITHHHLLQVPSLQSIPCT